MEVCNHTTATVITTMVDNEILAMDIIVALITMVSYHHVKPITIRALDIEDTTDFRFQLNRICIYCK